MSAPEERKKKSDFLSRVDWVQKSFSWNCIDVQLVKPGPVSGQRLACLQWFIVYQPYIFLPQKMSTFSGLKGCGLTCRSVLTKPTRYLIETEIKLSTFIGSWRKQGNSRKKSTSASLIMWKPLTVWITTNCEKFLKRWKYQTTLFASWETCIQVKKHQLEPDIEQQSGSKLGKQYDKAVYCHSAYLTYMQSTSCELPGWMSSLPGEISITSDMQMIAL